MYLKKELYELIRADESIFDFIQESSLDGLWYWDLENPENEWMNAKFWTELGYNPDEMPHKSSAWQSIINQEDLKVAFDNFTKHCENPNHPYDQIVRYTHKNSSTVWIRCRGLAIRDNTGKPTRMLGAHQNVTELKRKEEELYKAKEKVQESEEKYRAFYNNAPLSYQSLDENGFFIDINPMWLKTLGYERDEVIGKWYGDFLHPNYVEHFRINFPAFKKRGYVSDVQFRLRRKDNTYIHVSFEGCVGYTPEGKFKQTYCVFKDITEQKAIENELIKAKEITEESEHKYRLLYDNAGVGIGYYSPDGTIISFNQIAAKNMNGKPEDFIGKSIFDIFPKSDADFYFNRIQKAIHSIEPTVYEDYIQLPVEAKWFQSTFTKIVDLKKKVFGIQIISHDITKLKTIEIELLKTKERTEESEKKLKFILENLQDAFFQADLTGNFTFVNSRASRMYGYSENELIGLPASNLYAENSERNKLIEDLRKEGKIFDWTGKALRKDGSLFWVSMNVQFIKDNQGNIIGTEGIVRDITERKLAEEELKSVKASLELCLEASQIGIWSHNLIEDPEHIKEVSVRDLKHDQIFGYKEKIASWGQDKMLEHVIDEDREATRKAFDNVFEKGRLDFECRILWPDNTIHWIACGGKVYKDSAGQPNQINGTVMDITERKQAEQELISSQQIIEGILNTIPVRVFWKDKNLTYLGCNTIFANDAGFSDQKDIVGKNDYQLGWKEQAELYRKDDHIVIESGRSKLNIEEPQTTPEGKTITLLTSKIPYRNSKEEIIGILGVYLDITDRKMAEEHLLIAKEKAEESEARLLEAQKATKVGSWETDLSNLKVIWSDETYRIFEINSNTFQASHQAFLNFVHPDDKKIVDDAFVKSFETQDYNSIEHRIITAKDTIKYIEERWRIVFNEQGNPTRAIGTCQDITESKQAEQELKEAKERAEESDRLKSAFLANMSHEIRTPMNGILGFANLLKDTDLTGYEQQEYIEIIEKSGKRMLNIINDIIDISKIEAGLMESYINEFNINEQLDYTYTFFNPEAEAKGINLSLKSSLPLTDVIIKSDCEKVYAILANLVKNAIKYTEKGSIEFGYNLNRESGQKQLEFFVKDTGVGIPKDRQKAIFERFIQADIADKEARQGAGLGLAIAKAYVEILGGKIWVESEAGKGSTFYFTLPYNVEASKETIEQPLTAPDNNNDVRKLKIMIAEDDETSEILIEKYIKIFSKEILKVRTGVEAVEVCRNNPDIDLILMDIQMPDLNGYEATKQIRKFNKEIVIISQTAYGLRGDREKSIEAGCNDYITKPIDKDMLLSLIRKYFE